jgi:hypothetical protein
MFQMWACGQHPTRQCIAQAAAGHMYSYAAYCSNADASSNGAGTAAAWMPMPARKQAKKQKALTGDPEA